MSRLPDTVELNDRHVLVLRAMRERRSPTDLPRRQASEGRDVHEPLSARGVRAVRDDAIDRLARAVLAGVIPTGLPVDLWPPPDVRERALGLGESSGAQRARRDLLRAWLAGPPEPAEAPALDDRHVLSLRALREGWPPSVIAQRMPSRERNNSPGVTSSAATYVRTQALDRLVLAVLRDRPPAGLPPELWPPDSLRDLVRQASAGTAGYRPRRELVRRWLEDPTGRWSGTRSDRRGIRRGSLFAIRDSSELAD